MTRKASSKIPKEHPLAWVVEDLALKPSYFEKPMFGCLACYHGGRMVLVLAMREGRPWRGVLVPTERAFQPSLRKDFPDLKPHKILPKWLYLYEGTESFEETALALVGRILAGDERIGIEPKERTKRGKKTKS